MKLEVETLYRMFWSLLISNGADDCVSLLVGSGFNVGFSSI